MLPYRKPFFRPATLPVCALLATTLALGACGSDDDDTGDRATDESGDILGSDEDGVTAYAFVSGATPTFDAGQIERISLADDIAASGTYPAVGSDVRVRTDGEDVYQIGRLSIDSLTRFTPTDLAAPVWQFSVNGSEALSNPYDVVFESAERAYVIRYGSPTIWIVDPSAQIEADFKLGELDLTPYDADGVPEATDGVIVDGKLFVLMQRLTSFAPVQNAYVAVFDLATGAEIATGAGQDGLDGILLDVINPEGMQYVEGTDEILVTGRGNLFGAPPFDSDPYQGGVVSIDPDAYTADLLVDDGTADDNDNFIAESLVVSADAGYLLTYEVTSRDPFTSASTLRRFNPTTGVVADGAVAGLEAGNFGVLGSDPQGRLWVGQSGDQPGFTVIDPSDDSIVQERVATQFNPNGIVFIDAP